MSLTISRAEVRRRAHRVFLTLLLASAAGQVSAWASSQPRLVASSYSDRYHLSTCKIAQKIPPDELVVFKTPEEAFAADLVPCRKCNPPVPKGTEKRSKYNFQRKTVHDTDQES